ncbi:MAG: hypothetical protein MJZ37_02300 [Bacilli bacterium]|nr:hypothetical protein [Bacilli bacterium]
MKNKKILSLLVCLAGSLCALTGCDKNEPDVSGVNIDGTLQEVSISSLYDGMVALYQTKNYTLDVVHISKGYREEIPSRIFTRNYIGYDGTYEDLDVLFNDGTGIYRVSYGDDFLAGEYLLDNVGNKKTNLWDNSVVTTMYGMGGAYIKKNITSGTNEIEVTDKDYKLRFLETIVGQTNDFANVDKLFAKYENNKVTFDLSIGNGVDSYRVTLKNVGITTSSHLKMFVKSGGTPFAPNKDLSEMRRLIKLDNFVQRTYSISDGKGFWSGFQFFTPHYFFLTGSDPMTGSAYMEFDYKDDPTLDNDFDMWGIYMVNVYKDENNEMAARLTSSMPYNSSTCEVEECVRYPSRKLDLLTNLEYIKSGEIRDVDYQYETTEANRYYFIEPSLVRNFINNFSLDTQFQDVVFNTVAIEIKIEEVDKDSMVCFHAIGYYPTDGMTYDIILPLYGFGDANRQALDIIYSQYNK